MGTAAAPRRLSRGSGVLVHPTCLPGPHGSGDFGAEALDFIAWLSRAGQRYWQVLPLGPPGFGESPYSAVSAFAMNSLLIDLRDLFEHGWLDDRDLGAAPASVGDRIDFPAVKAFRGHALRTAAGRFFESASQAVRASFDHWRQENAGWLDDYALFMAVDGFLGGREWTQWPLPLARREPAALDHARRELAGEVRLHEFTQWICQRQWSAVRSRAADAGIAIIGDLPIFLALHSAEVWANPHLFHLGEDGRPTVVAGVPPDYFSVTGQRWGNPLYRWDVLASTGYDFWVRRFRAALDQVDIVRIDHFRGFEACWEIPASEATAVKGRWVPGPGAAVFDAARAALGDRLRVIAEDLGVITPAVARLRDGLGFPGMKVLQFAFGSGPKNPFLPHHHVPHAVVYTGTHDNDTTLGWFAMAEGDRDYLRRYAATEGREINWDLIRMASGSVADVAIFPLQDVLGLGSEARMNTPGRADGNWGWRFAASALREDFAGRLRGYADIYDRLGLPATPEAS